MKNIFAKTMMVVVAIVTFTFSSCTKEPEDLILGKWNTTAINASIMILNNPISLNITEAIESIEFTDLKTFKMIIYEPEDSQMSNPMNPTITYSKTPTTINGIYTLTDNQLTLIVEDDPLTLNIKTLEKKNMALNISISEPLDEDSDEKIDINIDMELEKAK